MSEYIFKIKIIALNKLSGGWYVLLDTNPPISIWIGDEKPDDLEPGPCKLILSQETAK